MCQLIDVMLCCAVFDLLLFSCATFFFSLEMKWKKNEKIVYTTAAADNRQHRARMVYISFSFFCSLIWYAPRSVFMIWDFVAQSVPKASNWSQKRAFTTVLSQCQVPFENRFADKSSQNLLKTTKELHTQKIRAQTIKWRCCLLLLLLHTHTPDE